MKLSVIIVAYDMQREIPRTLMSILPPLQKDVSEEDYEVIIIDNGSPHPLLHSDIISTSVPVSLLSVSSDQAEKSPVFCINQAVREHAKGEAVLICIDGARMFSSYTVRRTVDTLHRLPGAVTYVQSRHLGHQIQNIAVLDGYTQNIEDALMATVNWGENLDELYSISVFAGCHPSDQRLLQNESNAVGMRRDTWFELGGYNEKFIRPGGGLCNLDLFIRIMSRNVGSNILLMGESTFHQFHGGISTSNNAYFGDSLEEYKNAIGLDYRPPKKNFLVDFQTDYERLKLLGGIL